MELLYAVDLDVARVPDAHDEGVLDRVLAHVASWLSRSTEPLASTPCASTGSSTSS